jgi:regulator of protease activity HflC (stomatin/prohibitin superfamily)
MSGIAIVVLLVIGVPLLAFAVWQLLQEALVRIESGSVGLLIVRGKASDRILMPGSHFVWPFRHQMIQGYPMRELTYLTTDDGGVEETDFSDPPLMARLGDRAAVSVYYTIRFRILPDSLRGLHERVGPDGLKPLVRDQSRRDIIQELASDAYGIDDAFGAARDQLEAKLAARVIDSLHEDGFEVSMFNLRGIDLGSVNEAVAGAVRAKAGLELEKADARSAQAAGGQRSEDDRSARVEPHRRRPALPADRARARGAPALGRSDRDRRLRVGASGRSRIGCCSRAVDDRRRAC